MAEQYSAGDVLARLQLDISQWVRGLQDAQRQAEQFQQRFGQQRLPDLQLNTQVFTQNLRQLEQAHQQTTQRITQQEEQAAQRRRQIREQEGQEAIRQWQQGAASAQNAAMEALFRQPPRPPGGPPLVPPPPPNPPPPQPPRGPAGPTPQQQLATLLGQFGTVIPGVGGLGGAIGGLAQQFTALQAATTASATGLSGWLVAAGGIATAAGAAAVAVVSLTRTMGDFGLELQKEHAATGINYRDLQDLQKVAATVGEGPESISQMNRILQRRVAEAAANPSSQAAGVFQQLFGARTQQVLSMGQNQQQYLAFLSEVANAYQRLSLADRDLFATFLQGRSFQAVSLVMQELARGPAYIRQHGEALHAAYDDATIARMAEAGRRLNALEEQAKLLVLVDVPDWIHRTFGPELEQDAKNIDTVTTALQKLSETAQELAGVKGPAVPGRDRGYLEGGIPGLSAFTSPGEGPLAALPSSEQALVRRSAAASHIDPQFLAALRRTEAGGPGREFGVLSVPAPTIEDQARIAADTIARQQRRFEAAGGQAVDPSTGRYTEAFIRAFSAAYAPIGAANDPRNLNAQHATNLLRYYGIQATQAAAAPPVEAATEAEARAAVEQRRTAQERQASAATELELRQKSLEQLTALRQQERDELLQLRVRNEELRRGPEAAATLRRQLQQEQIEQETQFERQRRERPPGEQAGIYIEQIQAIGQQTHQLRLEIATLEQEPAFRVLRRETELFGESLQTAEQRLQLFRQRLQSFLREPGTRAEDVREAEEAVRLAEQDVQRRQLAQQLGVQAAQEAAQARAATIRQQVSADAGGRPQAQLQAQQRDLERQAQEQEARAQALDTILRTHGLSREQQASLEGVIGGVQAQQVNAAAGAETLRLSGAVPLEHMAEAARLLQEVREGTLDVTQAMAALQQLHPFDDETRQRLIQFRDTAIDAARRLTGEGRLTGERLNAVEVQQQMAAQVSGLREQISAMSGSLAQQRQAALVRAQVQAMTARGDRPEVIAAALPEIRHTAEEIDHLNQVLQDSQRPLQVFAETYKSTFVSVQEITLSTLQKTGDALAEFFTTGKFNAAQLMQGLVRDLNQLAVRTLFTQPLSGVADQLFQGLRGTGLGNLLGAPQPAAGGGLFTAPTHLLVGEAGPELVLPLRAMQDGGLVDDAGLQGAEAGYGGYLSEEYLQRLKAGYARQRFGALGGAGGTALGGSLAAALLPAPDLQRAQAAYASAFRTWRDPASGDVIMGAVDASNSILWASKVPGAAGYLGEPGPEGTGRQAGRAILSLLGSLAGAYAGSRLGRTAAQAGAVLHGPTMVLAGEAGSEAIIPLRGGGIPVSLAAGGRLVSRLPSGLEVPVLPMPRMAEGGMVVAQGGWMGVSGGPLGAPAGRYGASGPLVQMTVMTPNASSFRASQASIMLSAGQQLMRAMQRNG